MVNTRVNTRSVSPYSQICDISQNFEKIRTKMGNNPVGKKVNTPKVNTWVITFLRKYPGCYTFGIRFLRKPCVHQTINTMLSQTDTPVTGRD